MGGPGTLLSPGGGELWVAQAGLLRGLTPQSNGSLAVDRVWPLPEGTVPVAVADAIDFFFVLDGAGDRLLAYPRLSGDRVGAPLRLPVGTMPSAIHTGCTDCGVSGTDYVAVANAGSGDLSVYTWPSSDSGSPPAMSAERRVPVGGNPSAFAALDDNAV